MFQSAYQGGDCVEVFSPAGKRPMEHWKLTGKCSRIYDKGVKGYVLAIVGGAGSKMQAPKAPKAMMGLRQRHLVLQVLTANSEDKPFSVELGLTVASGTRRRLVLSSAFRAVHCTPHHAQIPLPGLRQRRGSWANLSIDMGGLVAMCFRAETFNSLDLVTIGAVCRVRKIFTMRGSLDRTEGLDADPGVFRDSVSIPDDKEVLSSAPVEPLPPRMAFPAGVIPLPVNWVISPPTLRALMSRDPLPISLPSDRTSSVPPSSRAFPSPLRLRPDAPLTTSAMRSTPTPRGEKRSPLLNRSVVSGRGVRGAQSPGRACSRAGAPEAALATSERRSVFDLAASSTRSYEDSLPQSSASERSIPLPSLPAQTSRGSNIRIARRPSPSITTDLEARGVGVEGTSCHPNTPPGVTAWEKEGIDIAAVQTTPSRKVPGLRGVTARGMCSSEGDVFHVGKYGLPARRRALEIAPVSQNDLHAPNRHPASGRIFADYNLDDRGSLYGEGSLEVDPRELMGSGLRGREQILGGGDGTTARRRTPREDAETGFDSPQGKVTPPWSFREGSTNDGPPLESDRPRGINTPRKPPCLSMNKKSNYLAATLQTDGTIPGKSRSSTPFSESSAAGGAEVLPLSRDVRTSHDESRRRRSSVCTPLDIFPPRDAGALRRSDECTTGDSISDKRSPGVSSFHRMSYTAVPPVASGASNGEISSRRVDGFMQDKIFGVDTTSRAHVARPAHSEQNGTPNKSGDAKNTNFSHGGRERRFHSFAALPTAGYGAAGLPSPERVDALQALLASSALEKNSPIGIMESVSPPGVGGAFEALASRREGGNRSGVGSSSDGSPGEDDMLEQSSSRNDALECGHKGCRDIGMIDLDNFESSIIDNRGGRGVVDSVGGDDAATLAIVGSYGDDRRVIQSPPERLKGNKRSGMDLAISPEPQEPWTITVYDRPTELAGDRDRRELEAKELALFDLENSYRSEFGSIDSSCLRRSECPPTANPLSLHMLQRAPAMAEVGNSGAEGQGALLFDQYRKPARVIPDLRRLSGIISCEGTCEVLDAEGKEVMEGAEALSGTIKDYRVSDAESTDFALKDALKECTSTLRETYS